MNHPRKQRRSVWKRASSGALVLLCGALVLVGWDGTRARAAPICGTGGFCWEHPLPQGNPILGAWGSSPNDLWLVGTAGTILHHDGKSWSLMASGTSASLNAVWGSAADDVWAAGMGGVLLHFDGNMWTAAASPTRRTLRGLWGSARDALWAVGDRGTILHFDGHVWSEQSSGVAENLLAVGGSGPDDVWAVGAAGMTLHEAGGRWTRVASPTIQTLRELWIPAGTAGKATRREVWAIAFAGPHLRWDGTRWEAVPRSPGPRFAVLAAWHTPSGAAMAMDRCGGVYRRDGERWMEAGGGPAELNLASPDPVAGARVGLPASLLGFTPHAGCDGTQSVPLPLRGLFAAGMDTAWAVGFGGTVLRTEGGHWERVALPTQADLESVWASTPEVWIAGGGALLRRSSGGPFVPVGDGFGEWVHAIGGSGPNDVWVVGENGGVARWSGARWTKMPSGTTLPLRAIWASGRGRAFAAGGVEASGAGVARGVVLRFDGRRWATAITVGAALRALHGEGAEVWSVGEKGTVLHLDGRRWSRVDVGTSEDLNGVWVGGPSEVWVVGERGTILRFDGRTWHAEGGITDNHLLAITGDAKAIRMAGVNGTILVRPRTTAR